MHIVSKINLRVSMTEQIFTRTFQDIFSAADRLSTFLEDFANIYYKLGIVYQRKGTKLDLQKALLSFDEVCQIRKRRRGNYHYDVALSIEAIGITLLKLGETFKAINKFS